MIPHVVYLANTSGLKVGITRHSQVPTRWIDQGATQALPVFRVATRYLSGLVEVALAKLVVDKTNWRAMLKGDAAPLDLQAERARLLPQIESILAPLRQQFGDAAVSLCDGEAVVEIAYPVAQFPTKISSFNLDKNPLKRMKLQQQRK